MNRAPKAGGTLAARLASYSAAAKTLTGRHARCVCATAAGSALALTTGATAGIIYSGPENIREQLPGNFLANPADVAQTVLDIDGHGLHLSVSTWLFSDVARQAGAHITATAPGSDPLGEHPVAFGDLISSGDTWVHQQGLREQGPFTGGSFPVGDSASAISGVGFAGLRLDEGTLAGIPQYDYGWLRVSLEDTDSNGYFNQVTAINWAYNDVANMPIAAGDAPEPGTLSLMLLALGSAGVLAWKRRKADSLTEKRAS